MSPEDILNSDISINEVESTVKHLHNGKSPGLDGISNELIKNASVVIVLLMCRLFTKILQSESFPISWGRALIVPLYKKKCSVNDPINYRGIALLSCVSKVFTKILNNRLTNCAENNDKMYEVQGGFTKGKSTIDQIFVFQSLVSKYVSKKRRRFYSVFVDFAKAFDSVPHLHLFYSLIQEGLHGRTICLLRNMYQN